MRSKFQYRFFCLTLTLLTGWITCSQPASAQEIANPQSEFQAASPLAAYSNLNASLELNRSMEEEYPNLGTPGGQRWRIDGSDPNNDNSKALPSSQQIVLEVRFVSLPADQMKQIRQMLIPGSFRTFGNPLPAAQPIATQTATGESPPLGLAEGKGTQATYVSATSSITQTKPTFAGQMNEEGMLKMIQLSKSFPGSSIKQAPSITLFSGQTVALSDRVTRPFVVDAKVIHGDFATAHQPIVQIVDDGTLLRLRGTLENEKIRIDGDLAISEILSAETYRFPADDESESNDVSIQVPQHKLKQIHWSTLLADGQTIMIDPADEQIQSVERKSQFGLSKKVNLRSMYFVTARRVPAE